jgi:hypothetical protein
MVLLPRGLSATSSRILFIMRAEIIAGFTASGQIFNWHY